MRQLIVVLLLFSCAYAQEIRRPSSETATISAANFCSGTKYTGGGTTLPNFWDSTGLPTSSSVTAVGTVGTKQYKAAIISGFSAASGTYSSLNLIINWACTGTDGGGCSIYYSTNSGSTWLEAETITTNGTQHSVTISLSPTQNLTQLKLQWEVCGDSEAEIGLGSTAIGYDIRTEGTIATSSYKRSQVISTE